MLRDATREKVENIIRGIVVAGANDHCTATRNFLCASYSTSQTVKREFDSKRVIKEEQEEQFGLFASDNNL